MKKGLLLGIALLLIAGVALAQAAPSQGYLGLFVDDTQTTWCATVATYTLYFYAWPTAEGLDGVSVSIDPSDPSIIIYVVPPDQGLNPDIGITIGAIPGKLAAIFDTCQYGWTMIYSATMMVMADAANDPRDVTINMYPDAPSGLPMWTDCTGTEYVANEYTHIYINDVECPDEIVATRESTWGAIKNMYE